MIIKKDVKLKVGQKYKDHNGDVWEITAKSRSLYPFEARSVKNLEHRRTYTDYGRFDMEETGMHNHDLVELVEDVKEEAVMPKVDPKFKVGQKWRTRDGKRECVIKSIDDDSVFPIKVPYGIRTGQGWLGDVEGHALDLVELVEDVTTPQAEEPVQETKKTETPKIELKIGQKYKDRKGRMWEVTEQRDKDFAFPFICYLKDEDGSSSFAGDGRHGLAESQIDLVELVEDAPIPEAQEEKAPVGKKQILEGVKAGQQVRLANGVKALVTESLDFGVSTIQWGGSVLYYNAWGRPISHKYNSASDYFVTEVLPIDDFFEYGQHYAKALSRLAKRDKFGRIVEHLIWRGLPPEQTQSQGADREETKEHSKAAFYPAGTLTNAGSIESGDIIKIEHHGVWCEGVGIVFDEGDGESLIQVLNRETGLYEELDPSREVVLCGKEQFRRLLPTQRWRTRGGAEVTLRQSECFIDSLESSLEGKTCFHQGDIPYVPYTPERDLVELLSEETTLFVSPALEVYQVDGNIIMLQRKDERSFLIFDEKQRDQMYAGFESIASACCGTPMSFVAKSILKAHKA